MLKLLALALVGMLAAAGLATAEEMDAVITKPPKAAADGTLPVRYERLKLDSKGQVISQTLTSTLATKETKIAIGKFNEQRQKWEAAAPVAGGLDSVLFKDADTRMLQVRLTTSDDHKTKMLAHFTRRDDKRGFTQILVTKVGGLVKKSPRLTLPFS